MDILNPGYVRVELDPEEIHELSIDILRSLDVEGVTSGAAVASLALSLGRLVSPVRPMDEGMEMQFIQDMVEWAISYFADGKVN